MTKITLEVNQDEYIKLLKLSNEYTKRNDKIKELDLIIEQKENTIQRLESEIKSLNKRKKVSQQFSQLIKDGNKFFTIEEYSHGINFSQKIVFAGTEEEYRKSHSNWSYKVASTLSRLPLLERLFPDTKKLQEKIIDTKP